MTELEAIAIEKRLKSIVSYRSEIRGNVRLLWNGTYDDVQFYVEMDGAIQRGFRRAWAEGMREVGLSPEDMTRDEEIQLLRMIVEETNFIFGFADAIVAGSKENGGNLGPLMARVDKWVARYTNVKNQALQAAKNDPVLEWVLHANESCPSCLKMNGQRRRSSVFARLDIRPQHPRKLECMISAGGVDVCQCLLVPTDQSPSRGRLPKLP